MDVLRALGHALALTFGMTWEITWALVLGFTLAAVVQAVVRRESVTRLLGDDRPRTLALAAALVNLPIRERHPKAVATAPA